MAGQGVEVGVSFLLENEAEIARAIALSGGKLGRDFSDKLSAEGKKAFDELVAAAEKAAKDVNAKFSKTDLKFRNNLGQFLTPQELERLSKGSEAFKQAVDSVNKFRNAVESTGKSAERNFNLIEAAVEGVAISLTSRLTDAIGTSLGSLRGLIGGFLELDSELRLAAAAAGETGAYERLGTIVDKVGIEAAGTTKQVAELATSLVRAGFSVKEIETALPGVVRGAEATGTGFASFGDIVGNTLRGFQLDVDKTTHVVDVLVNTANSSNASIEGLGYTFEYTAPIAKALGISLEEVAAAAGLMANAGIQGSVAGTGLRTGLQKIQQAAGGASPEVMGLARGQERLTGVMRKLGAQVVDTNGKLLPLDQVFISLKSGLEKLNQADQVQLANVLFGDEAGSKFLAILNQSDAAITKMFRDMGNSAGAADTARTSMSGMGLEVQQLTGTMDSLGTQIGGVIAAGLRPFVGLLNAALGSISALPAPVKTAAGALIALTAAATATTVAMMATNAVVLQLGGFSSLAKGAKAAGLSIASMGSGAAIVLSIAAAAAVLTGNFRETDRTTKQLLQTTIALGVGIAVFKGMTQGLAALQVAQSVLNARTKAYAVLLSFVQALNPGKALIALGIAAAAAAGTYALLDSQIKVTGEDTEELSKKANELRDEIKKTQDEIDKTKKLKLDTTEAQQRLDELQAQLRKIETPLSVKLDMQKVDGQIKALEAALGKLGRNDPQRSVFETRIAALKEYKNVLDAIDKGSSAKNLENLSKASQNFVKQAEADRKRLDALESKKATIPASDRERRSAIDKEINALELRLAQGKEREQAVAATRQTQKDLALIREEIKLEEQLAAVKSKERPALTPATTDTAAERVERVGGIDPTSILKVQINSREKIKNLKEREKELNRELLNNQDKMQSLIEKEERTARGLVVSAKEKLEIAKSKLEVEQMTAANLDKQAGLDSARLSAVRNVADAYANLASAQAQLVQSGFDVSRARVGRAQTLAEQELQTLKDRGASAEQVREAEMRISRIKRESEGIERSAMLSAIEATQKRFEIENKILELKQRAQVLEQESAIRSADQGVLQQRSRLLELQGKLQDPSMLPEQKKLIQEQIKIQEQSVSLSKEQARFERERAKSLGVNFALERETQKAQQQSTANQQRAAAAAKGFEVGFSQELMRLDQAAGKRFVKVKELVGVIEVAGKPVEKIYAETVKVIDATTSMSDAWKDLNDKASKAPKLIKDQRDQIEAATRSVNKLKDAYGNVSKLSGEAIFGGTGAQSVLGGGAGADKRYISPKEREYKEIADMAMAQTTSNYRTSYSYGPNGMSLFSMPKDMGPNRSSWFDREELEAIMKIENATNMSADAFFQASEKATYLERALAALNIQATKLEKQKWYEEAIVKALTPGGTSNMKNVVSFMDPARQFEDPSTVRRLARSGAKRMADKEGFDILEHPIAGAEGLIDKIAAELADADAKARNLAGSITGVRDAIGRPLDIEDWQNYQEYLYGINGLYTQAAQRADEFGKKLSNENPQETLSSIYRNLSGVYDETGKLNTAAQSLNETYDSLGEGNTDMSGQTQSTLEKTIALREQWESVYQLVVGSADTLKAFASPQARWAGGGVDPSGSYTINELGQESWLDRLGNLRLITAPAYSKWTPPSRGLVLPANVTAALKERGAFSQGPTAAMRQSVGSHSMPMDTRGLAGAMGRLERGLAGVENAMRTYRPMDVQVVTPDATRNMAALQRIL